MASRYPEHDIFPKEGMDHRDPSGLEWFANLWRPERAHPIQLRPGFGQLTQQDCTAEKAQINSSEALPATGGYQKHLGSYLYNSNFGHRQIISVFEAVVQYSASDDPGTGTAPTYYERAFETVHGAARTLVVSIYDLTTNVQWEEIIVGHTSEHATNELIPTVHGHFETSPIAASGISTDFINFKLNEKVTNVSFAQIGDSVVLSMGAYGVWIYHGIDVAKTKQRVLSSTNLLPNRFGSANTVTTNYPTGDCEGSVLKPVGGVKGINGEQFVYFTKTEFPNAEAAALVKGRMVYALRGVLYFSDVGQPGAIMADNFAEIQTEGSITAMGEYNGQLFVMTETESHLVQIQQNNRAGEAFANVVNVTHVRISKRTGCVGPRSIVQTPFGVAWVSDKGCHLAGAQQSVEDLSDPIRNYWDSGIVDPTTHYYTSNGAGGTKVQPDVIYKHQGQPTLSYEPQTETLFAAYDDHLLVYQFRHKSWSIWPLSTSFQPTDSTVVMGNLVSSYLPETQTPTSWPDSTGTNNMTGAVTAPPVFDGNDYYTIGDPANLEFSGAFTVEAWCSQNHDSSQGSERVISKDPIGGARSFTLTMRDNTGNAEVYLWDATGAFTQLISVDTYKTGGWHHLVVVNEGDGKALSLYVDGVLQAVKATGGRILRPSTTAWEIGRAQGGIPPDYLEGRCDTVRFYNAALTHNQVIQNYNAAKVAHGHSPNAPQSRQTINCLQVLSDSQGAYIVGGLYDSDEDGLSPTAQSSSYYITELGRGGATDRSCKNEDFRRYGWGRYAYSKDPTLSTLFDPYTWIIDKPQRIFTTDDGSKVVYEFPVYFEGFRYSATTAWPAGFRLNITWNAEFTFEGVGIFPESAPLSNWAFTNTATSLNSARIGTDLSTLSKHRFPCYVLRLSAPVGASARTDFTVVDSEAINPATTAYESVRVLMWQQQHLYAPPTMSTRNRLKTNVQWGIKTGQIGLNEGKVLRVRGINAVMQTSTSQASYLYNTYTVSDYKRLSGQYPDYANTTPGNRQQLLTNMIRERMLNGRRVFNSMARWAPVAALTEYNRYLIDSPELNSVVSSVSAKGEHVSVGLFGYATDKADELKMHRLSLGILDTGNRRRKGR